MARNWLFAGVILACCAMARADVAVIAHPSLAVQTVDSRTLQRLYLGRKSTLEQEGAVVLGALPPLSPIADTFNRRVLGMTGNRLLAFWSRKIFTGQEQPPREFATQEELKQWVAATPNALGYVDIMIVDDQVKVLLTVADEPK